MWQWIMAKAVGILVASGFVLAILLFSTDWVRDKLVQRAPEGKQPQVDKRVTTAFWALEGIAGVLLLVALAAIVISEEGIAAMVTPATIGIWFLEHGIRILVILLIGIVLWMVTKRFMPALVHRAMAKPKKGEREAGVGRKKREDTLLGVFMGLSQLIIILIVGFMILGELNINIAPILAGLGIAGIAVGFGAQYLIRDLIAGVFILMENQFRVGDVAKIADIAGLVEEVHLRKTVLRDLDGIVHHVPNGEIRVASNYTRRFSRVNLDVSVAYGTDLDQAMAVINRVGQELAEDENWKNRIITPPQALRVNKFGDSGIDIKIVGDVKTMEQWATMGELRLRLKKAFDAEGIEIPWPHVKLFFGEPELVSSLACAACATPNPAGSKFCSNCGAKLSTK
jgi:small conductance mechanosensitive channel